MMNIFSKKKVTIREGVESMTGKLMMKRAYYYRDDNFVRRIVPKRFVAAIGKYLFVETEAGNYALVSESSLDINILGTKQAVFSYMLKEFGAAGTAECASGTELEEFIKAG